MRLLYGLDVQELYVWRPLLEHALEHLGAGKFISTEADAFWLPDTAGTDYRNQHTKTTIILGEIDVDARRLGYFHNAGYHTLDGEDFAHLFRLGLPADPTFMPMFAELFRPGPGVPTAPDVLRRSSLELLRKHAARRATDNPVDRFRRRFEVDLPAMAEQGMALYHAWVFGTLTPAWRGLGTVGLSSALARFRGGAIRAGGGRVYPRCPRSASLSS